MPRPWLSVILPTYNGSKYLRAALDSIVAQDQNDIEVLAVDDGSDDGSLEILRAYARILPLAIIEVPHSGNWVANTNLAMQQASGTYLSWLHQDDVWSPDRLRALQPLLKKWSEGALLFHPARFINSVGRFVGKWRCPFPNAQGCLSPAEVLPRLLIQNFIATPATIFRADAAREIGWANDQLWFLADWDLWLRLSALGPVVYSPAALSSFRLHPHSQTILRTQHVDDVERQYSDVLARNLISLDPLGLPRHRVESVARFSAALNLALMNQLANRPAGWLRLAGELMRLGPSGWASFFRNSRIVDRVVSRLRARLSPNQPHPTARDASCHESINTMPQIAAMNNLKTEAGKQL